MQRRNLQKVETIETEPFYYSADLCKSCSKLLQWTSIDNRKIIQISQ